MCNCSDDFTSSCRIELLEIKIKLLAYSKQHHQLLNSEKVIFEIQRLSDILSDNATTISEASCHAFQYEKFLVAYSCSGKELVLLGVTLRKAYTFLILS